MATTKASYGRRIRVLCVSRSALAASTSQFTKFIVGLTACCCITSGAQGEFLMMLQGTSGSPIVSFELSGSGVATGSFGTPIIGAGFDITDGYNPFPPSDIGRYMLRSGSATWTNITTSTTVDVISMFLQDSSFVGNVSDRFGVTTSSSYTMTEGDMFAWSGSGTIDLSARGLIFDDLIQGTGVGQANLPGAPGVLLGRLTIVAEPTSLALSIACVMVCLCRMGRR